MPLQPQRRNAARPNIHSHYTYCYYCVVCLKIFARRAQVRCLTNETKKAHSNNNNSPSKNSIHSPIYVTFYFISCTARCECFGRAPLSIYTQSQPHINVLLTSDANAAQSVSFENFLFVCFSVLLVGQRRLDSLLPPRRPPRKLTI